MFCIRENVYTMCTPYIRSTIVLPTT